VDGSKTKNVNISLSSEKGGENILVLGDAVSAEVVKIN